MAEEWGADPAYDAAAHTSGSANWAVDTGDANGYGDGGNGAGNGDEPAKQFEKKVNKKRLEELESLGRPLMIFLNTTDANGRKKGLKPLEIKGVHTEVAKICSDDVFEYLRKDKNGAYYELKVSDGDSVEGLKYVFNWIKQCGEQKTVVAIDGIDDLVTPEKGYQPLLDVLKAANKLKVPHASFGKFLLRKAKDTAKDNLVSLDTVKQVYDTYGQDKDDEGIHGLREVFAKSIFVHWYDWQLEDEEHDEYMAELQVMCDDIKDLRIDIKAALKDKNDFIDSRREKKRAERAAEAENGFGGNDENAGAAASQWAAQDTSGEATNGGNTDWQNEGTTINDDAGRSTNWAEEMSHAQPAPVAASGW